MSSIARDGEAIDCQFFAETGLNLAERAQSRGFPTRVNGERIHSRRRFGGLAPTNIDFC
jgi:hypothetical protein